MAMSPMIFPDLLDLVDDTMAEVLRVRGIRPIGTERVVAGTFATMTYALANTQSLPSTRIFVGTNVTLGGDVTDWLSTSRDSSGEITAVVSMISMTNLVAFTFRNATAVMLLNDSEYLIDGFNRASLTISGTVTAGAPGDGIAIFRDIDGREIRHAVVNSGSTWSVTGVDLRPLSSGTVTMTVFTVATQFLAVEFSLQIAGLPQIYDLVLAENVTQCLSAGITTASSVMCASGIVDTVEAVLVCGGTSNAFPVAFTEEEIVSQNISWVPSTGLVLLIVTAKRNAVAVAERTIIVRKA